MDATRSSKTSALTRPPTATHPRRRHSAQSAPWKPHILLSWDTVQKCHQSLHRLCIKLISCNKQLTIVLGSLRVRPQTTTEVADTAKASPRKRLVKSFAEAVYPVFSHTASYAKKPVNPRIYCKRCTSSSFSLSFRSASRLKHRCQHLTGVRSMYISLLTNSRQCNTYAYFQFPVLANFRPMVFCFTLLREILRLSRCTAPVKLIKDWAPSVAASRLISSNTVSPVGASEAWAESGLNSYLTRHDELRFFYKFGWSRHVQ
jgi:hypothetical protein